MDQVKIVLKARKRGFHIITDEILDHLPKLPQKGLLHLFIQHTSAGICINENADPTVLSDMTTWFNKNVRENEPYFQHTEEGPDDMPSHIKAVMTGGDLTIPIVLGKLALGTWQGIYLAEFRDFQKSRTIIATLIS